MKPYPTEGIEVTVVVTEEAYKSLKECEFMDSLNESDQLMDAIIWSVQGELGIKHGVLETRFNTKALEAHHEKVIETAKENGLYKV
jgi:hypothetical protein